VLMEVMQRGRARCCGRQGTPEMTKPPGGGFARIAPETGLIR